MNCEEMAGDRPKQSATETAKAVTCTCIYI